MTDLPPAFDPLDHDTNPALNGPGGQKKKINSRRHPFLQDRPKGVFYPEAVGMVPGYPRNEAAWLKRQAECRAQVIRLNAEGGMGRKGVPNGWAGRRAEADAARAVAQADSIRVYDAMVEQNLLLATNGSDAERAEVALKGVIAISLDVTQPPRDRMAAYRTVLEYTKVKPASRADLTVSRAEDFLSGLIGE